MGIASVAYTAAFLILSFMKVETTYWAFIFPALVLVVVGADIQFNVVNVCPSPSLSFSQNGHIQILYMHMHRMTRY